MAMIPGRANLGQATVDVQRSPIPTMSNAIAQGAQDLAGGLNALADEGMRAQMEMKQRAEEADRLKTAASLSELDNGMASIRQRVQADLAGGKIASREDAQKRFEDESLALNLSTMEKVPEALRDLAKTKGNEILSKEYTGLGTFLDTHATSESRGNLAVVQKGLLDQVVNGNGNVALIRQQFDAALTGNTAALRFTPEELQAQKLKFDDGLQGALISHRINVTGMETNVGALREELGRMQKPEYMTELGDGKPRVRDYIETRIRELNAGKEAKNREWEISVTNQMRLYADLLENGGQIPPGVQDDLVNFERSIRGSKFAEPFALIRKENTETRSMALSPLTEQQALIAKTRQEAIAASNDPVKAVALKHKVERQEAAFARNVKAIQENPGAYAERVHGIKPPAIDFNQDLTGQFRNREQWRVGVESTTGVNPGLIRPEEAASVVQVLKALPVAGQEQIFKAISGSDQQTQRATLAQLGKVDPVTMYAGAHTVANHTAKVNGVAGRSVGRMLLEGGKMVSDKQITMGKGAQSTIDAEVAKYAGGAMAHDPEAFAAITPMVTAFLAFQEKDRGSLELKPSAKEIQQAVDIVTGGVVAYNDSTTILPYGMTAGDFKQKAPVAITNALTTLGYSESQRNSMLNTVTIKPAETADEFYLFNGRDPIFSKDGSPVRVRVR